MSDDLNGLQKAWDSVETLPPIEFTEAEARALLSALLSATLSKEGE